MRHDDIERLARTLGTDRARTLDPERVAARVTARLRAGEPVRRATGRLTRWALPAAAALAILLTNDAARRPRPDAQRPVAAPVALSELDSDGLGEALDSLVFTAPAAEFVGWGIGTMNADELETLLDAMEG